MQTSLSLLSSFVAFLILFLWVGALAAKRSKNTEDDYLLGSRSFGKWMVGLSAGATGNTSFILIAAVGMGYTQGFGSFLLWASFFLGELTFWTFFAAPICQRTESTGAETVSELVTTNIGAKGATPVRSLVSLLIFVFIGAYIVAQFAGSAKILNSFFGMDTSVGVFVSLAAILAYCTTGGLRASIWTDIVQAIVMIGMTIGVMLYALTELGGISGMMTGLTAIDPSLVYVTHGYTFWTGLGAVIGFAVMGAGFGLSQPHITVRIMAGRSAEEVQKARWIYLAFIYGTGISMTFFGICCRLLLPDIADPEASLPVFALQNFPPVIVGVVLAGMFSTIASSADSQILACSSALARDMFPKFGARMSERFGVRYQQVATVLTGLVAAFATVYSSSSVFDLVIFSVSVLSASVGVAMLIVIFRRPSSASCLVFSMLAGVITALVWRYFELHNMLSDVVPGFVVALAVHEILAKVLRVEKVSLRVVSGMAALSKRQQVDVETQPQVGNL